MTSVELGVSVYAMRPHDLHRWITLLCWAWFASVVCSVSPQESRESQPYEGVYDIPVHQVSKNDLDSFHGPHEIIAGEYVTWHYAFPWKGFDDAGNVLQLHEGLGMRFIEATQTNVRITNGGVPYTIHIRPHVGAGHLFLFVYRKAVGLPGIILRNRIGDPTRQENTSEGGVVWTYTHPRYLERTVFETVNSVVTGSDGSVYTVSTQVPHIEVLNYFAYNFRVYLSKEGDVTQLDDLWTPPHWVRKT